MSESKIPAQLKDAISGVLDLLKSGDLPEFVAKITFPASSKPLAAWSSSNRLLCAFAYVLEKEKDQYEKADRAGKLKILMEAIDKIDFRGFNQWNEKGRYIKKGEKCYCYILAPSFKKFDEEVVDVEGRKRQVHTELESKKKYFYVETNKRYVDTEKIEKRTVEYIAGFRGIPVFEKDQTFGKEIKYEKLELPKMRYIEVAEFLGLTVKAESFKGKYYGYYSGSRKEIVLATPDMGTFFHELSHAVDDHLLKAQGRSLKGGQQMDQEIIAQFSANVLAYMSGYKIPEVTAYTKKYIEHYANSKNPEEEVIKLMSRIEKITDFITNFKTESPSRKQEKKEGEEPSDAEKLAKEESKSDNSDYTDIFSYNGYEVKISKHNRGYDGWFYKNGKLEDQFESESKEKLISNIKDAINILNKKEGASI